MSGVSTNTDNFCYRHPDRSSFVLCQRCGRTVCSQCQTPAAVGVHCPECMRESRQSAPRTKPALLSRMRRLTGAESPIVTYVILALCGLIFVAEILTGVLSDAMNNPVVNALLYYPPITKLEAWRMLSALFVHGTILHLLFNGYSLYVLGPELERLLGRWRFAALFGLSGLGGSVAVLLTTPDSAVVGASGAIFGLFSAYFVIVRHLGGSSRQLMIVILINLAIGFIVPGIAWQAHLGGMLVGALIGLIFVRTRDRANVSKQPVLLVAVLALLIVLTVIGSQLIAS